MARLIDADALMEKYHKTSVWDSWVEINSAPTIDPVHAAGACYCNECKFACIGENEVEIWCYCKMTNRNINLTDFCSYGQLKED